ncbi:MAG: membrane protein insertase YidC [bacterium]
MDKRTIYAVVLSSLIVVLWQIFVLAPQEQKMRQARLAAQDSLLARAAAGGGAEIAAPPGEAARADCLRAAAGMAAPGDSSRLGAGALAPAASEAVDQDVAIETDLFKAKLSTRGARISSYALLGFPSHRGGVVDLIPENTAGAFGLTLHTRDGELPLDEFVFVVDRTNLTLRPGEEGAVAFSGEPQPGLRITKRFALKAGTYDWQLDVAIDRTPDALPVYAYTIDLGSGISLTEKNQEQDLTFVAGAIRDKERLQRKKLAGMKENEPLALTGKMEWATLTNKYFLIGLGVADVPGVELAIRPIEQKKRLALTMKVPVIAGAPGAATGASNSSIRVYAGPQEIAFLEKSPLHLGEAIDYGWSIIQPISQLLLKGLKLLYRLIPNYGIAIILISIAAKLAFYRLTHQSIKSMKDMKKVQGELEELRKKYNNDPKRMNEATMALYKKNGINPMAGCLPMLLQMPVFMALYNVLNRTIELRGAPFFLWIDDLSAPDALFHLPFTIPFLGSQVCALPIVMGVATFYQTKMTTVDPKQKMLLYMMPIFMTVIFFNFPSGLVLYWLVNTLLTIMQQYLIDRKDRATAVTLAASAAR